MALACNQRGCEGCVDGPCTRTEECPPGCYPGHPDCRIVLKDDVNSGVAAPDTTGLSRQGAASKLEAHDEFARAGLMFIVDWCRHDPEPLLAMARGRHAEGHYRFGDSLMFEYSQDELRAEAAQELADAIVYLSLLLRRA